MSLKTLTHIGANEFVDTCNQEYQSEKDAQGPFTRLTHDSASDTPRSRRRHRAQCGRGNDRADAGPLNDRPATTMTTPSATDRYPHVRWSRIQKGRSLNVRNVRMPRARFGRVPGQQVANGDEETTE